jgi:abortive infection bacteriophage resistance protein
LNIACEIHEKSISRHPKWSNPEKTIVVVAIKVWDFGLLSRLFSGMQYADKNWIAKKYGQADGETLAKWLCSLNFIRNVSAHHSR